MQSLLPDFVGKEGKTVYEGYGLFGAAMWHGTTPCLRVLTTGFSDPNIPLPARGFSFQVNLAVSTCQKNIS
jgi:hypothetical protein